MALLYWRTPLSTAHLFTIKDPWDCHLTASARGHANLHSQSPDHRIKDGGRATPKLGRAKNRFILA